MLSRGRTDRRGTEIIGLLDVGTSKVTCLVAAIEPPAHGVPDAQRVRVLGVGYHRSRGLKSGVITDLDEAEAVIRVAIAQAERAAGVTLDEVLVAVSCGRLKSLNFAATVNVDSGAVEEGDIERLMAGGRSWAERDGRTLIHLNRIGFRLDGATATTDDPRGMAAQRISADIHVVAADEAPIRNLLMVIERCYLSARALVAAPYASALAATSEEERRLGVTCIDIGGGTATFSVFMEGHFIYTGAIPIGGHHITFDIARSLQTPLAEAERIKTLYGTMIVAQSDEHEAISYALAGDEEGCSGGTTKARLAAIIRPRVASMLAMVRERLDQSGIAPHTGERVVLTGGSSQLVGIGEFAADALSRPVRVARPQHVSGLPQRVSSPAFSTVAGLLAVAVAGGEEVTAFRGRELAAAGYLGRVGQWLRSGF